MTLTWDAVAISGDRGATQMEIQNLDFNEFQFLTSDSENNSTPQLYGLLLRPRNLLILLPSPNE